MRSLVHALESHRPGNEPTPSSAPIVFNGASTWSELRAEIDATLRSARERPVAAAALLRLWMSEDE